MKTCAVWKYFVKTIYSMLKIDAKIWWFLVFFANFEVKSTLGENRLDLSRLKSVGQNRLDSTWVSRLDTLVQPYVGKPAELGGISPPEFFLISTPPLQEGLSWAKYSPPRKNFWANYLKISPPRKNILENFRKILEFWCRVVKDIPPFEVKKSIPLQNFFQKILPPMKIFKISPTPRSWVLAHVCHNHQNSSEYDDASNAMAFYWEKHQSAQLNFIAMEGFFIWWKF